MAAVHGTCDTLPVAEVFQFTLDAGARVPSTLGRIVAVFDPDAFSRLRKRIASGYGNPEYVFALYSMQEDKLLYRAFASLPDYELRVHVWAPNYEKLADAKLGWIERELGTYSETATFHVHPVTGRLIDHRIAWLAREERRVIRKRVHELSQQLAQGAVSRAECARELIRLNPLAVRANDIVVAATDDDMLESHADPSVSRANRDALLYHTGYRRALLSVLYRSRISEDANVGDFHRFIQQRHVLEFGGPFEDSAYPVSRELARATAERFYGIISQSKVIDAARPRIYTWNRPHRAVADAILTVAWTALEKMVAYMEPNAKKLEHEFRTALEPGLVSIFVAAFREGRVFLYEWFGVADHAWAWTTPANFRHSVQRFFAGYALQLRDEKNLTGSFYSARGIVPLLLHEMAHSFEKSVPDPRARYPDNWFETKLRDTGHSPMFVRAERALLAIAIRSGVDLPSASTAHVRAMEDTIDASFEETLDAKAMRARMGLPLEDEEAPARKRSYDAIYTRATPMDSPSQIEEIDDGNETVERMNEAFIAACREGDLGAVSALLRHPLVNPAVRGNIALTRAIRERKIGIVRKLVQDPRVTREITIDQIESLMYSHDDAVEALIHTKLPHVRDTDWIEFIRNHRNAEIGKRILRSILTRTDHLRDLDSPSIETLLMETIRLNDRNLLSIVLAHPRCDPAANDNKALDYALLFKHLYAAQRLIEDPRVGPGARHNRALMMCARYGYIGLLRILVKYHGVDPSINNNEALLLASKYRRASIVEFLVSDPRVDASVLNDTNTEES